MTNNIPNPRCHDSRKCFAKRFREKKNESYMSCSLLNKTYFKDGECPFCKPDATITDGKKYDYDIGYLPKSMLSRARREKRK